MSNQLIRTCLFSWLILSAMLPHTCADEDAPLITVAESSEFTATATYDEVMFQCRRLAEASTIHLGSMGESFRGRDLPLLIISNDNVRQPSDLAGDDRLVIFAMANIHAGEVCGKEALLMLARELRDKRDPLLEDLVILFAPIYNADGNDPFSLDNRRNQVGPARGMGQRPNAQGLDLNRDNIKLESPEARALARLITEWNPAVCIDTHTTNGSYHRYTITYDGPRHPATPGKIVEFTRETFLPAVGERLRQSGYESFFYGNFNDAHDRWDTYPDLPRYCTHYFGLRGTIGILSEAYAYASYKDRVLATREFVRGCLSFAAEQAASIRQLLVEAKLADESAIEVPVASTPVALRECEILGYEEAAAEGGKTIPSEVPRTYRLTYYGLSRPTFKVKRPFGYLISSEASHIVGTLKSHNIKVHRLLRDTQLELEVYSINDAEVSDRAFQGHRQLNVIRTTTTRELRMVPAGSLIVPARQAPLGGLIANLLEPSAQDGLCAWNCFDSQIISDGKLLSGCRFPVARILNDVTQVMDVSISK